MNGSYCYPTVLEYCRLCNEKKSSFVDIFSTMVYRDGCSLAKKLSELYGIEASSPDDDLSKFICIQCLRQIMRHGNLTYNLWSTLDYLMRMHAEEVMDIAAYDIPEDSLDFLYSKEKDFSTQPLVLLKKEQPGGSLISSCRKKASSPDDDLSKFICIECLRQIMRHGNLTYNLWSTLDYLMRMHAEEVMDVTSFEIPVDSLDFLFSKKKDFSLQPLVLEKQDQPCGLRVSSCGNKDRGGVDGILRRDKAGSELEEEEDELPEVEFCWCTECNEEFLSREELRLHTKKHAETGTRDSFEQNDDLILSSEEYKLLSGEVSLLKNKLRCSKCQKEFASEKKLVRHVKKYDFQCEHRSFVNLNNQLKSLKSKRAEDNALMDTRGRDSTFHVNSKLYEATSPLTTDLSDNGNGVLVDNKHISDNTVEAGATDVSYKVKQRKIHEKLSSSVGSHSSMVTLSKQDPAVFENCTKVGAEIVKYKSLKTEVNVSERVVICDYCSKPYSLKSQLSEHIVVCHLSVVSHKCSICHTFLPTESELKVHEAIHFSKSKYLCSLCCGNFPSRAKVSIHLKNVHDMEKIFACSACFLCFPSRAELALHQHCHSSDSKKYCCSKCGKKLMDKKRFSIHVGVCQLGQLLLKCGECGKECLRRSELNLHLLSHNPDRNFACHMCPRKFLKSGDLSLHIRNFHLKLKPHECGICKKRFALRAYLREHYSVHSDDRPFKCKHCEKYFKTKNGVSAHTRKMHVKHQM